MIDYWQQFIKTGSVQDYLAYRNSVNSQIAPEENSGKPDVENNRDSDKRGKNQGKR